MKANRDRNRPITGAMIQQAKENLILRRVTHLDQLADKLREPRVRRVVEPMLVGTSETGATLTMTNTPVDLGLVQDRGPTVPDRQSHLSGSNPTGA